MRKFIAALLLIVLLLSLCACSRADSGGEKETPAPAADTPAPTEEPEPFTEPPEPLPAVRVEMTRADSDNAEKALFTGRDENGGAVWEREFSTEYRTELTLIQEIGLWQDRYYFNSKGTVVCLSLTDGATLWENAEFGGASISGLIDERNGNVYLCGWYGPDFFACDAEGKTLSKFESAAGDFYWPGDMAWSGENELVIWYHGGGGEIPLPYFVDLRDFSISWSFGYAELDAGKQYWANIFISDFVEQSMYNFPKDNGSDFELASFAHMFCKINRRDALRYDGNYDSFSLDTVNELCLRFFGREIHPSDGVLYENQWGMQWTYENGTFRFPSGDGESYNRFAVVTNYLSLPGTTAMLYYDVYELKLEEYWDKGMDASLYRMTPREAKNMAAEGRIEFVGAGEAEVLPIEQDGHDGYYLHWMHTDLY